MHLVKDDADTSVSDHRSGFRSFLRRFLHRKQELRESSLQQGEMGKLFYTRLHEYVQMNSDERYRVDQIPNNHGSYTVIIGMVDQKSNHVISCDRSYRGHHIVVININYGRPGYMPISIIKGEYNISLDGPQGEPFWRCDDKETIADTLQAIYSIFDCYIRAPRPRHRASN